MISGEHLRRLYSMRRIRAINGRQIGIHKLLGKRFSSCLLLFLKKRIVFVRLVAVCYLHDKHPAFFKRYGRQTRDKKHIVNNIIGVT